MSAPAVLVLNAGSSSLKFALFAGEARVMAGSLERLDPAAAASALGRVVERLAEHGGLDALVAVGHRVVHGGDAFVRPVRLDPQALSALHALEPLDPDHLPAELSIVRAVQELAPGLPQVACFDTAFHATLPRVARLLGIPRRFADRGIRRYGFHGLSYQFQLEELGRVAGPEVAHGRVVMAHLGSGSSLAATRAGACVETTMGFTPNSGVVMGTRSGDLDAGLLVHLLRTERLTPEALDTMLSKASGLLGVSGVSADMRDLLAREATDPASADAVALYCYSVRKAIGALATTVGGLDTLVFAAGIGENAPVVRARICAGLEHLGVRLDDARNTAGQAVISAPGGACTVRIVRTSEETIIARETLRVLSVTESSVPNSSVSNNSRGRVP
jgi:acetate kinase